MVQGRVWHKNSGHYSQMQGVGVLVLELSMQLKYPSFMFPEIAGAGGFLQGDQGDLMTAGFPEQTYPNGALYQVQ